MIRYEPGIDVFAMLRSSEYTTYELRRQNFFDTTQIVYENVY